MGRERTLPWRVGRKVGRTIYAIGDQDGPEGDGVLIGVMDTAELAREAVEAHNQRREWVLARIREGVA